MLSMDLFIISQSVIPFAKKGILFEELEKKIIWSILLGQVTKKIQRVYVGEYMFVVCL